MDENDCETPESELGRSGDCEKTIVGKAFLLSCLVMTFLIIINMYIAVILENNSQWTEDVQESLTDEDYDLYYEILAQFDPDETQYIRFDLLSDLLDVLEPPLRTNTKFHFISMGILICKGDMVFCVDILDTLTKDFFSRKGNANAEAPEINEVVLAVDRPEYESVSSTLWRQREEYCVRLIQNAWRRHKDGGPIPEVIAGGSGNAIRVEDFTEAASSVLLDEEGGHKVLIPDSNSKSSSIAKL